MTPENLISIVTVIVNLLIGATAIIVNIIVSNKTIRANQKLNRENAGKNRVIYGTEQMHISIDNLRGKEQLNTLLSSGNYTILSTFVNSGNFSETRLVLGKIKP